MLHGCVVVRDLLLQMNYLQPVLLHLAQNGVLALFYIKLRIQYESFLLTQLSVEIDDLLLQCLAELVLNHLM